MIEIMVNTARFRVAVKGHATPEESAQYREICSAVSALAQGMMFSLNRVNDEGGAYKSVEYRPDPGDLMIRVYPEHWAEREARRRIDIYADGMELLAMAHSESVHMIRDGEEIRRAES